MALRDWVNRGGTTNNDSLADTGASVTTNYGTANTETIDDDYATYYGRYVQHTTDGEASVTCTSEHTWTGAITLASLKFKYHGYGKSFGNYGQQKIEFKGYVKQGGAWVSVFSDTQTQSGTATLEDEQTQDLTTGWTDITGVKVTAYGYAYSYEGGTRKQDAKAFIYEVEAWVRTTKSWVGVI